MMKQGLIMELKDRLAESLQPYLDDGCGVDASYYHHNEIAGGWICLQFRDFNGTYHEHVHYNIEDTYQGWGDQDQQSTYSRVFVSLPPEIREVLNTTIETFTVVRRLEGRG